MLEYRYAAKLYNYIASAPAAWTLYGFSVGGLKNTIKCSGCASQVPNLYAIGELGFHPVRACLTPWGPGAATESSRYAFQKQKIQLDSSS